MSVLCFYFLYVCVKCLFVCMYLECLYNQLRMHECLYMLFFSKESSSRTKSKERDECKCVYVRICRESLYVCGCVSVYERLSAACVCVLICCVNECVGSLCKCVNVSVCVNVICPKLVCVMSPTPATAQPDAPSRLSHPALYVKASRSPAVMLARPGKFTRVLKP